MLHDPTRDIPQLLTVERFGPWLDMQPPDKRYDYGRCNGCAIAQFIEWYLGDLNIQVTAISVYVKNVRYELPFVLDAIAADGDHSFGAAAKRAKAILNR